jgi:hypothetical protein
MPASSGFPAVRDVALPTDCGVAPLFDKADLADAYAIAIDADDRRDLHALASAAMGKPKPWAAALMRLRDVIMGTLGIKTARQIHDATERAGREHIHFFPVLSRSEREIILGEDDSHLDFRASLMLRQAGDGAGQELVITTVVHCHNSLGRVYLAVITPFHRLIVRSFLRNVPASWSQQAGRTA